MNDIAISTKEDSSSFSVHIQHGGQNDKPNQAGHRLNGDLLGFKFDVWEGGHRVPLLMRWPEHIKAGTRSDQLISSVDMLGTIAGILGYRMTLNS